MEQKSKPWCPLFYAIPLQLKYYDVESRAYRFGLGFHNFIIDGESGELKWIPNVVNQGRESGIEMEDVVKERGWEPLGK